MILAVHSVATFPPLKDPSLTLRMTRGRGGGAGGRRAAKEPGQKCRLALRAPCETALCSSPALADKRRCLPRCMAVAGAWARRSSPAAVLEAEGFVAPAPSGLPPSSWAVGRGLRALIRRPATGAAGPRPTGFLASDSGGQRPLDFAWLWPTILGFESTAFVAIACVRKLELHERTRVAYGHGVLSPDRAGRPARRSVPLGADRAVAWRQYRHRCCRGREGLQGAAADIQ